MDAHPLCSDTEVGRWSHSGHSDVSESAGELPGDTQADTFFPGHCLSYCRLPKFLKKMTPSPYSGFKPMSQSSLTLTQKHHNVHAK